MDGSVAALAIQSVIRQQNLRFADNATSRMTTALPAKTASFEDIGKIVVEVHGNRKLAILDSVVLKSDPYVHHAVTKKSRSGDMDRILRQYDAIADHDVRIAQVHLHVEIVVADVGAEQQRLGIVDQQLELRQEARVGIE